MRGPLKPLYGKHHLNTHPDQDKASAGWLLSLAIYPLTSGFDHTARSGYEAPRILAGAWTDGFNAGCKRKRS